MVHFKTIINPLKWKHKTGNGDPEPEPRPPRRRSPPRRKRTPPRSWRPPSPDSFNSQEFASIEPIQVDLKRISPTITPRHSVSRAANRHAERKRSSSTHPPKALVFRGVDNQAALQRSPPIPTPSGVRPPIRQVGRIRCIIGIDYGTTYTGVSYVFSNKTDINDVTVFRKWPGQRDSNLKTPTRIAYAREAENNWGNEGINKWGFEVKSQMKAYSWTKLLLGTSSPTVDADDPNLRAMAGTGMLQLPPGRSAADVCEDFLREVRKAIFAELKRDNTEALMDVTPIECWITIPATWSDKAKNSTKAAAVAAGFVSKVIDEVNVIPEPEAAAITALTHYTKPESLLPVKVGDNVMIVDCGGGTVDLITYTIKGIHPLKFEDLVVGQGGMCGATYVDRNFLRLMEERFGLAWHQAKEKERGHGSRLMEDFEIIKRDFRLDESTRNWGISASNLKIQRPSSDHYDAEFQEIKISKQDMIEIFEPVVKAVIGLIKQQISQAASLHQTIQRLVIVGGFGESPYLFDRIKQWAHNEEKNMLICRPEYPQSAIVLGAALRGLCGTKPLSTRCRRHYGFSCSKKYLPGMDTTNHKPWFNPFEVTDGSDGYPADDGQRISSMEWMIAKGAKITSETTRNFCRYYSSEMGLSRVNHVKLYSTASDSPAEFSDDPGVEYVGSVRVDHSNIGLSSLAQKTWNGKTYCKLEFDLKIHFGDKRGILDFSTWVDGVRTGTASISYDEE